MDPQTLALLLQARGGYGQPANPQVLAALYGQSPQAAALAGQVGPPGVMAPTGNGMSPQVLAAIAAMRGGGAPPGAMQAPPGTPGANTSNALMGQLGAGGAQNMMSNPILMRYLMGLQQQMGRPPGGGQMGAPPLGAGGPSYADMLRMMTMQQPGNQGGY